MRIKLTVAYDGTNYIGWQKQPKEHGPTVEGKLTGALTILLNEPVVLHGSGRTDGGVHALGQVAHFDTLKPIPARQIPLAINRLLPDDIKVLDAVVVSADFHARKGAVSKTYRYTLSMKKNCDWQIFGCAYFWPLGRKLDLAAMEEGAKYILGEHDFEPFSVKGRPVVSSLRRITQAKLYKPENEPVLPWQNLEDGLCLEISGNGFLYKMVRLITARLVQVGSHKLEPQDMQRLLLKEPYPPVPPAPAKGLMLMKVAYRAEDLK